MSENDRPESERPPESGAGRPDEHDLLTPEERATLSPAEQRALARKRLAERIRATIPDEQRRMTRKTGAPQQAGLTRPSPAAAPPPATTPPAEPAPVPTAPPTVTQPAPGVTAEAMPPATTAEPSVPAAPPPPEAPPVAPTAEGAPQRPQMRRPAPPREGMRRRAGPPPARRRPVPPAAALRPTNLPTRAKEPTKVHPVGVATLLLVAVAVAYFFADIWGVFFVPLLLVLLWRKVDSRELLAVTAVIVASIPLIMVLQGIDLGGQIDSSYALKQMLAHAVAGIAVGLVAVACIVAAIDWRYRVLPLDPASDPQDEPVLVSFLPSRKGLEAATIAKARPLRRERA